MIKEKNPYRMLSKWYKEALKAGIGEPSAMALATAGNDGRPSSRMVLFKEVIEPGITFFTHYNSRKARDLDRHPFVSAVIYWEPLSYQVRIEGRVEKLSRGESDRYFNTRPRGSQLSAWASPQSREISSLVSLEKERERYDQMYKGKTIPRPDFWGGYRILPVRFEFWKEGKDRLHERILFERQGKSWRQSLLAP